MRHQSFVIEAEAEEGIRVAEEWAEKEFKMQVKANPDFIVLRYGLFSVEDARRVLEAAASAAFIGEYKVIVISASRVFHEAQNALLKLFEEPPPNTYIFLVLPTLGGLLPTLRSRVQVLHSNYGHHKSVISEAAQEFIKANKERRSAIIKKLTNGKDEEEKRKLRDEAIAIVNGIEVIAYKKSSFGGETAKLLSDISILRSYLHDRSAPVKMILEHLSLVIPKDLL